MIDVSTSQDPAAPSRDQAHMARALTLAARGLYTTDPNPRVGCVVVRDDRVLGEGWHVRAGEPHAEVLALRAAGPDARGATVYVTLEPCSHTGRTPPCADALIAAGVARVVCCSVDPNPRVAGGGIERLKAAGCRAVDEGDAAIPSYLPHHSIPPIRSWPGPRIAWEQVSERVAPYLQQPGHVPLLIGCDCSVVVGTSQALIHASPEDVHVLYVDGDLTTPLRTQRTVKARLLWPCGC